MHSSTTQTQSQQAIDTQNKQFYTDVMAGLKASPKFMSSKYFYDAVGDKLFQNLMNCDEYYPTNCELEIFSEKTAEVANAMIAGGDAFDLIELGAGDATKSSYLLKYLLDQQADFTYLPIDISDNIINYLNITLPVVLPGLKLTGLNGDYFEMLKKANALSNRRKVVMFLGSNIGNMPVEAALEFCKEIRSNLSPGDRMLIGVDLKKNPKTILAAYNDRDGITKNFNINLLERINRELSGNFEVTQFDHYPMYDPETGACKSYLVSLTDQTVKIREEKVKFAKDEYIFMEISQKYGIEQIHDMAAASGFKMMDHFYDEKKWFTDAIWVAE